MAENIEKPKLVALVEILHRHGVEFLVIGGAAAVMMGSPVATFDIDICYRRTRPNLERLAAALQEIHPTLRGAPADLPFKLDAASLALGSNFTFDSDLGPVDFLGWLEPLGDYEKLFPNSEEFALGDLSVRTIGLDDLVRIKEHIRRPKDQAALFQLREIKKLREAKG